jgi:hypothetical protein
MKEKIYKYSVITFVIINFITLYLFYDYFTEKPMMFHGLGLFFNFIRLIILSLGFGIVLLLLRFYFHIRKKKNYLKSNFFYVFSSIFSFNLFINWVICVSMDLIPLKTELALIVLGLITVSIFMLYDIYRNNFQKTNHVSE